MQVEKPGRLKQFIPDLYHFTRVDVRPWMWFHGSMGLLKHCSDKKRSRHFGHKNTVGKHIHTCKYNNLQIMWWTYKTLFSCASWIWQQFQQTQIMKQPYHIKGLGSGSMCGDGYCWECDMGITQWEDSACMPVWAERLQQTKLMPHMWQSRQDSTVAADVLCCPVESKTVQQMQ